MAVKAIQQFMLGTVMKNEKQAQSTLNLVKQCGYDGIELCGFMTEKLSVGVKLLTKFAGMPTGGGPFNWAEMCKNAGLKVVSYHSDMGSLERDAHVIADKAKGLGTDVVVLTGLYGFDYSVSDNVKKLCERLNAVGFALNDEGVQFLYHNHNFEFLQVEKGITCYDMIIAGTDPKYVNFEFDSYWATDAGADAGAVMDELGDRLKMWHINDRSPIKPKRAIGPIITSDSCELGYGTMNLDRLSAKAKAVRVQAVVLESHRNFYNGSPIDSMKRSAEYMNTTFGESND